MPTGRTAGEKAYSSFLPRKSLKFFENFIGEQNEKMRNMQQNCNKRIHRIQMPKLRQKQRHKVRALQRNGKNIHLRRMRIHRPLNKNLLFSGE